jgi:hypothetical protein
MFLRYYLALLFIDIK